MGRPGSSVEIRKINRKINTIKTVYIVYHKRKLNNLPLKRKYHVEQIRNFKDEIKTLKKQLEYLQTTW